MARNLVDDPQRFLATVGLMLTFLGFLASAIGAVSFSDSIAGALRAIPWASIQDAANSIAFILVTLLIALTSIIIGELVPKTLALNFAERFALVVARPCRLVRRASCARSCGSTTVSTACSCACRRQGAAPGRPTCPPRS